MQKLFINGEILTMRREDDRPEAVLVENGKIRFVGSRGGAEALCRADCETVDLQGRTLLPAFIDPHSHISMAAQFAEYADLSGCGDFDDIIETLRAYRDARKVGQDGIVIGYGYDHNFLKEGRHPDKGVLDRVATDVPVYIFHTSSHMGVANTKLLELADIDARTPDPQGGRFGRLNGSMEPDGYIEETGAMAQVLTKVFPRMAGDPAARLEKVQRLYLENGITTVQDGAASADNVRDAVAFAEAGKWKVDVVSYIVVQENPREVFAEYPEYDGRYHNRYRLGGCKIVLDGSPQGRSAWLSRPYEGETEYRGYPVFRDDEVDAYVRACVENGRQLLAHCNGDAAADQFLRAYRRAVERSENPDRMALRPVMIHCQTVRQDQLDEMAALHMIPSIFVSHVYYWGDVHVKNLGRDRAAHISPARSALARGLTVNFHQDTPVVPPDMLHTVWCAANRITRGGEVLGEEERISVYDALKAVTCNAAYAYFEEARKGTIEAGKLADLVILDQNPLTCDKTRIRDIAVCETIKEGVTFFRRNE